MADLSPSVIDEKSFAAQLDRMKAAVKDLAGEVGTSFAGAAKAAQRETEKSGRLAQKALDRLGEQLGKTVPDKLKNLSDQLGDTFQGEALTQFGEELTGQERALDSLKARFEQLGASLGSAMQPLAQAALPAVEQVMDALTGLAGLLAQVTHLMFGTGESGEQAAQGTGALAKTAAGAGAAAKKTAKELKGVLASFDQLNLLKFDSGSGTSSSGGSGPVEEEPAPEVEISPEALAFVEALRAALGAAGQALAGLWSQLERLGSFAWAGLRDFYDSFLKPLGSWALGEGLPRLIEALTGGLAAVDWGKLNAALHELWTALEPFAQTVGEGLVWLWENALVPLGTWVANDAAPAFLELLAGAAGALNGAVTALEPAAMWLWESFLTPLAQWTGDTVVAALGQVTDLFRDLTGVLSGQTSFEDFVASLTPVQTAILALAAAFGAFSLASGIGSALSAIQSLGEGVAAALGAAGTAVGGLAAIVGGAMLGATNFFAMLENGFDWLNEALMVAGVALAALGAVILGAPALVAGVVAAIVAAVATAVVVVKEHWEEIKAAFLEAWDRVQETWNQAAAWLGANVIQPMVQLFAGLWTGITTAATGAWASIQGAWNSAAAWFDASVLQPLAGFFSGVWTGASDAAAEAWALIRGAFEGAAAWFSLNVTGPISEGFHGFVNGLVGFAEGFVNLFIRGINGIIGAFNRLQVKIPDWVPEIGGSVFGLSIPRVGELKLPRLANGAVIPPNRQFAAVLGDQRSGVNVEAPLTVIEQALENTLRRLGGTGELNVTVVSQLDGREVARNTVRHVNDMTRAAGRPVLLL